MIPWSDGIGLPSDQLVALQGRESLFHSSPSHPSYAALSSLGIKLSDGATCSIPVDAILLVPIQATPLERLAMVVQRLLGPGGCPWDQAQTHASLKKYLVEEAYELFDAIDHNDPRAMCEELGDVLLQPLMHAEMSRLAGGFSIEDVATAIADKLVRRHPHVFGSATADTPEAVLSNWDAIKRAEKGDQAPKSILDGVPQAMPSLLRALEISKRAARAGFEWPNLDGVLEKLDEERGELLEAITKGSEPEVEAELGDLLFTIVNIARWLKIDPEEALRHMLGRFQDRFAAMERTADVPLQDLSPQAWDALWVRSKEAGL